jgi:hypothetical protein
VALVAAVAFAVGVLLTFPALADPGKSAGRALTSDFKQYKKVPDEQLAKMRGGFVMPDGILSFSVDLHAQINGAEIYRGNISYDGMGRISTVDNHAEGNTPTMIGGVPVIANVRDGINQVVASVRAGEAGSNTVSPFDNTTGFVATVQNTLSNVAIQQQMQVHLKLSADHFLPSVAATQLRSRLQQMGNLGVLR